MILAEKKKKNLWEDAFQEPVTVPSAAKNPWEMTDEEYEATREAIPVKEVANIESTKVAKNPWEMTDEEYENSKPTFETNDNEPKLPENEYAKINTDDYEEIGSKRRLELSGLDTIRDKKKVLEKYYDDVEPVNDGFNFRMKDRDSGKVVVLNKEGWVPSLGDFADAAPDLLGSIAAPFAGAGTAAATSFTGPAAVATGLAGAAAGYSGTKNLAQKGLNTLFGNEDTQELGEYATGVGIDAATGVAQEVLGPLAAKGVKAVGKGIGSGIEAIGNLNPLRQASRYGAADAPELVAERLATFADAGLNPTAGMVGGKTMATKELAEGAKRPEIREVTQGVYDDLSSKIGSKIDEVGNGANLSVVETGQAVKEGLGNFQKVKTNRDNNLYQSIRDDLDGKYASGANLSKFKNSLADEFNKLPEFQKKNFSNTYNSTLEDLDLLIKDAGNNRLSFDTLKESRTMIGSRLADKTLSSQERSIYSRMYGSMTSELENLATEGGEHTLRNFKKATSSQRRLRDASDPTSGKLANKIMNSTDEAAYGLVLSGTKKNVGQLRQIMHQLRASGDPELVGNVQSSIFTKIGSKNGEFDLNTFARNYSSVSPEALKALGQGEEATKMVGSLGKLSDAVNLLATDFAKNQNWSNTAAHTDANGLLSFAVKNSARAGAAYATSGASLVGEVALAGLNRIIRMNPAKMADPKFVNNLAYIAQAKTPTELTNRINSIASRTNDELFKNEIRNIGLEVQRRQQKV